MCKIFTIFASCYRTWAWRRRNKTYGLGYTPCGFADLSAKVQKIIEF